MGEFAALVAADALQLADAAILLVSISYNYFIILLVNISYLFIDSILHITFTLARVTLACVCMPRVCMFERVFIKLILASVESED